MARTARTPGLLALSGAPAPELSDEAKLAAEEEAFLASLSEPEPTLPTFSQIAPLPDPTEDLAGLVKRLVAQALSDLIPVGPAPAPVLEAPTVGEVLESSELSSEYPVVYANPKIIDEQFYVVGSPYRERFVKGRYVAKNPEAEVSVRACLEAQGKGFADRWKGEDRREWVDRRTGFRTSNENARYDFELYHED